MTKEVVRAEEAGLAKIGDGWSPVPNLVVPLVYGVAGLESELESTRAKVSTLFSDFLDKLLIMPAIFVQNIQTGAFVPYSEHLDGIRCPKTSEQLRVMWETPPKAFARALAAAYNEDMDEHIAHLLERLSERKAKE